MRLLWTVQPGMRLSHIALDPISRVPGDSFYPPKQSVIRRPYRIFTEIEPHIARFPVRVRLQFKQRTLIAALACMHARSGFMSRNISVPQYCERLTC